MPRRKQGHSREIATGGCIKKRTEPGIVIVQNDPFKHFSTTGSNVIFKIKKTVPTKNARNEKTEHTEASKSLNDQISSPTPPQAEVNNNVVKPDQVQNETKSDYSLAKVSEANSDGGHKEEIHNIQTAFKDTESSSLGNGSPSKFPVLQNEASSVHKVVETPTLQPSVIHSVITSSLVTVDTSSIPCEIKSSSSPRSSNTNGFKATTPKTWGSESLNEASLIAAKDGKSSFLEMQESNYRISSSEMSNKYSKDMNNPLLEKQSELPSSVYGTSVSNIDKVLLGIRVPKNETKSTAFEMGKMSFLQEILEKKHDQTGINNTSSTIQIRDRNGPVIFMNSSFGSSINENEKYLRTDSLPKLKLHIPENITNEDSNSSVLSTESQKASKFPKITSPQILEQHISKIISENAAIVETTDPLWCRRYKQSSGGTSSSEGDLRKIPTKFSRVAEDKSSSAFELVSRSKLHSALLGSLDAEGMPVMASAIKDKNTSQSSTLNLASPSGSMYSKMASVSDEDVRFNSLKCIPDSKQSRYHNKHKSMFDKELYNSHPQNPEGSIIKDLLLKSKSQEDLKMETESDDKLRLLFDPRGHPEKPISKLKCSQCSTEFTNRHNLEVHHRFCGAAFPSLRDPSVARIDSNAQSKPEGALNFPYKARCQTWDGGSKTSTSDQSDEIGPILKKQLLMPRNTVPHKRRKVSDSLLSGSVLMDHSSQDDKDPRIFSASIQNFDAPRGRSQSVHLFGGEVQVLDGPNTKKFKIKSSLPDAFSSFAHSNKKQKTSKFADLDKAPATPSTVIVNIAQPGHNSGGSVHMSSRKLTPALPHALSLSDNGISNFSKVETVSTSKIVAPPPQVPNLSYPYDFFPGPDSKPFFPLSRTVKSNDKIQSNAAKEESTTPGSFDIVSTNAPFYSPIFPKSFESPSKDTSNVSQPIVPTVLFTPSSPTMPDSENILPGETEPSKKFLAPARPTSLPLKKKTFTMVSSTLVSPDTPRPKKNCVQMYLNGHAYTYLGLKCSTRSTYCSIYRPQPMFVPQETNPKLSMYSNWQVMPAKEELSPGLTPGQMISYYCSKQNDPKAISVNAKSGEALIFTHSSYWTYRSQDQQEKDQPAKTEDQPDSNLNEEEIVSTAAEQSQESTIEEVSHCESAASPVSDKIERPPSSAEESSLHADTENTLSEEDLNNSNDEEDDDEDDDDCLDDGTLTDSSGQPPKRVRIFEGGFKSNEDYTYVRGRGRGKYVCEECGIRCKKPSMLKKHIRTHTDLRPYKCRHCSFAFKTKGNLTKHMKSKAHHKKCTELGIVPVPTVTDDSQIDQEALAKQIEKKKKKAHFSDGEDADDDDEEDSEDSEDECESDAGSVIVTTQETRMLSNGHSKKPDSQEESTAHAEATPQINDSVSQQVLEQEAVRSLLNLSALGEPSQWSCSTGDLTDVTSGDTDIGSINIRSDPTLLSPYSSHNPSPAASTSRASKLSEQWLSTDTLGHRPRSYSADVPQSSGKDALTKFKFARSIHSDNTHASQIDESAEFGGAREQYARRYSISVAREARKPHAPTEWNRLNASGLQKWPEGEASDQPMDLSVSRNLGKSVYGLGGSLLSIVTQEEEDASIADPFGEPYQLKSLPVLSPQVLVDYESNAAEPSLLALHDDQTHFGTAATSRALYYVQDLPVSDDAVSRKNAEGIEDPPSPDIADYAVCSPVSPPNLEEGSYYYVSEGVPQTSTNSEDAQSPSFVAPASSSSSTITISTSSSGMEEGKCVCRICNKMFAKSSQLRLHVNIHYFERPFRCDNCAVSFRTKGHLQKHKRSVSHYNKVNMNLTFGTPTVDNPRPFKCADCKIAFRIHGHLAKHLRSKMHIMKLECLGKLPFGMYAEMERSGVSLNDIDTTDCNNSLESLQVMAQKLYKRDPRRMRWQGSEQDAAGPSLVESLLPMGDPLASTFETLCPSAPSGEEHKPPASDPTVQLAVLTGEPPETSSRFVIQTTTPSVIQQEPIQQRVEGADATDPISLHRPCTCHICGKQFKGSKFLQIHLYCDHPTWNPPSVSEAPPSGNLPAPELTCNLCGRQYPNQKEFQQHLLSHAQPRPFVCELCDAGFTSSSSLVAHKATHQSNALPSEGSSA